MEELPFEALSRLWICLWEFVATAKEETAQREEEEDDYHHIGTQLG
jgi:hypothetical protein